MAGENYVCAPAALAEAVRDVLCGVGVPFGIAAVEAEVMVEGDLCGVPSHGVLMLSRLLAALKDGRARVNPTVKVVRDHGATCVLDGDNGPGRYTATRAMDEAMARARTAGVGVCLAIHTTHWGRAHTYAARAARQGMMGFCTTNAIPTMAVAGSRRPIVGNNPFAIGVPRADGSDPVVIDLAMSQAAFGRVGTYKREGRSVPPDWGLDPLGQPTTDPAAILTSGMVLPMGGYKGIGLALMMELLTAGLSGGPFGHEMVGRDSTGLDPDASKLFLAVDVAALGDRTTMASRIDDLVAWIREAAPDSGLVAPGDRGWAERTRHLVEGVPLHPAIVEQLEAMGVVLPRR
jgi:LDH2 family malate/lactate/ureidoglycolate dehydrogenase